MILKKIVFFHILVYKQNLHWLQIFITYILACSDHNLSSEKWLSRSSHWLTHIQNTLNTACLVAQCLDKDGASVLVHGTGGQDATLIVSSIAQVILNPDCRTVRGMYAFPY